MSESTIDIGITAIARNRESGNVVDELSCYCGVVLDILSNGIGLMSPQSVALEYYERRDLLQLVDDYINRASEVLDENIAAKKEYGLPRYDLLQHLICVCWMFNQDELALKIFKMSIKGRQQYWTPDSTQRQLTILEGFIKGKVISYPKPKRLPGWEKPMLEDYRALMPNRWAEKNQPVDKRYTLFNN